MPSARAATRSPLVLMADAHEWFSRALESVLVPGGYSVVKAYTATGLLQQLELTEPDAQILAKADADRAWAEGLVAHATQLYNGRGVARRARELGAEARRRNAPLACVAFAVDAGEADGPSAETVARVLRETGRTSDALGRIGPREFVVIAPETGADAALRLAERLAGALTGRPRRRIAPRMEFLAGYDAVPDAAAPKFDPTTLLAHASAALAAATRDPEAGRIRRFENEGART